MELDEQFNEKVKTIIVQQLRPALIKLWEEKGPAMQAAITADVVTQVRSEVRTDHAENRARLQAVTVAAVDAEKKASSADSKATEILARVDEHYLMAVQTQQSVATLSNQFSTWTGERTGRHSERSRWVSFGKAAAGIITGGGLIKIIEFFHSH